LELRVIRLCLGLLLVLATPVLAAWPNDVHTNLAVCTAAVNQEFPQSVSDGAGGMFIAWLDSRNGTAYHLYAQHLLASGDVDPAWPASGAVICSTSGGKSYDLSIITDGAGGAIVTWPENRDGNQYADLYSQHVLSSGIVDPSWPVNGRPVAVAPWIQYRVQTVSDGAGGVIAVWQDGRSGSFDIYAHHVLASGAVDPAWPAQGRAICTAARDQYNPSIVSDNAGGALIAWDDFRSSDYDVYALHVLASGAIDPAWPANGLLVCGLPDVQYVPAIVPDGSGGGVIVWLDHRSGSEYEPYAQHLSISGVIDPAWPSTGRMLCTTATGAGIHVVVSDMAGGAIVAWSGPGVNGAEIFAQRILASGVVDPAWPPNGRAVCSELHQQQYPSITSDGEEGAIVLWSDPRNNNLDLYAQHVTSSGAIDPTWPNDGQAVTTAVGDQKPYSLTPVSDGNGGLLVAWQDERLGNNNRDIFAQRLARYGRPGNPEAEVVEVKDVPDDGGGEVEVVWRASYVENDPTEPVTHYGLFRSTPALLTAEATNASWDLVATVNATRSPTYACKVPTTADSSAAGVNTNLFMIRSATDGVPEWDSKPMEGYSVANLPPAAGIDREGARAAFRLAAPSPNPARSRTSVRFGLPTPSRARLAVFDATGRLVRVLESGELSAGGHLAEWNLRDERGRAVGAGLYFVGLETSSSRQVRRLAVTR
jgi:hypothetical protein